MKENEEGRTLEKTLQFVSTFSTSICGVCWALHLPLLLLVLVLLVLCVENDLFMIFVLRVSFAK